MPSGLARWKPVITAASITAIDLISKSGTNRLSGLLRGNFRDSRFNATDPFAAVGKDGKRVSDGLNRNQFGGTIGGPIVRNKLFYFGSFQMRRRSDAVRSLTSADDYTLNGLGQVLREQGALEDACSRLTESVATFQQRGGPPVRPPPSGEMKP